MATLGIDTPRNITSPSSPGDSRSRESAQLLPQHFAISLESILNPSEEAQQTEHFGGHSIRTTQGIHNQVVNREQPYPIVMTLPAPTQNTSKLHRFIDQPGIPSSNPYFINNMYYQLASSQTAAYDPVNTQNLSGGSFSSNNESTSVNNGSYTSDEAVDSFEPKVELWLRETEPGNNDDTAPYSKTYSYSDSPYHSYPSNPHPSSENSEAAWPYLQSSATPRTSNSAIMRFMLRSTETDGASACATCGSDAGDDDSRF